MNEINFYMISGKLSDIFAAILKVGVILYVIINKQILVDDFNHGLRRLNLDRRPI